MAHLPINSQKPGASAFSQPLLDAFAERRTLEDIRELVTSNGCTNGQFERAKETVGTDPHHVAMYLQRYAL